MDSIKWDGRGPENGPARLLSLYLLCYPFLQFTSSSPDVRAMACRAVSHLVFESPSVELLMSQCLVKKVAPLLVDTTMAVREAAAGALRYGEIYSQTFLKEFKQRKSQYFNARQSAP